MGNEIEKVNDKRPVIAMCYDFDKTLSPKDMQEYTLFDHLGVESGAFWRESNDFAKRKGMCRTLSYMKLVLDKFKRKSDDITLTRADFKNMGKAVDLFKGVDTWFDRINSYGEEKGVVVEHYIISAGLKEIIEGTTIRPYFKEVYASCFYYDKSDVPVWPEQVVNYTQKTQYLFRINKGCLDLGDEDSVNKASPDDARRIPFSRFIYIGDSDTDIPAMKVVKKEKGFSIGVFNPDKYDGALKVCALLDQDRINFFAPADYTSGSVLEVYVKKAIDQIKANSEIVEVTNAQKGISDLIRHLGMMKMYMDDKIKCSTIEELDDVAKDVERFFRAIQKQIIFLYKGDCLNPKHILQAVKHIKSELDVEIKKRKQRNDKK